MDFLIANTFTASLARLTGDEQKVAKTTAFDLQMNPANPGMHLHRLDKARDRDFWSVRVNRDLRLIVHRTPRNLLLCFVAHHDDAYHWAECRRIETHPTTGAAQIVEVRQRVEEVAAPRAAAAAPAARPLFAGVADADLLACGVPPDWLADVRAVDEDGFLALADHLPAEAAEALLQLATGGPPPERVHTGPASAPVSADDEGTDAAPARPDGPAGTGAGTQPSAATATHPPPAADPFAHPDALRRFRVIENREELERALASPWDQWTVFLHPSQRDWVERSFSGPARVSGSAGTGKTIVALHRAVYLARRHPQARVLLATFSEALAQALRVKLRRLVGHEPKLGERIEVHAMDRIGERLYTAQFGAPRLVEADAIRTLLADVISRHPEPALRLPFVFAEWRDVVDAWQLQNWEAYRDVPRLGRRTRLPEARRQALWSLFEELRSELDRRGQITLADLYGRLTATLRQRAHPPFDYAIVDEAQDISVAQLRFLAALGGDRADALFFAGDLAQRIFQQPFSWKSQGVDVRGRARTLRVNYRTSHQIRRQADRLLGPTVADVDGLVETRHGTVSVFNGPEPTIRVVADEAAETAAVAAWLQEQVASDTPAQDIGVFVRDQPQLPRAAAAVAAAGLAMQVLDQQHQPAPGKVSVATMHWAKGMEFRAVAVLACDEAIIPSPQRIEAVTDDADLEEVYNTERHLLYVACTRARDRLLVSGVAPVSEFLDDFAEPAHTPEAGA